LLVQAQQIAGEMSQTRWLLMAEAQNELPVPLLCILICWLAVLFVSFGLFSPRNATVVSVLFVCACSISAAIFLILELNRPPRSSGRSSAHCAPTNLELGACAHHIPSCIVLRVDDECEQSNYPEEQLAGCFGLHCVAQPDSSTKTSTGSNPDGINVRKLLVLLVARVAELADALDSGSSP
jgi:hypothetical protein